MEQMEQISLVKNVLASGLDKDYRENLINNFTIIELTLNGLIDIIAKNDNGYTKDMEKLKIDMHNELENFKKELQREVRAIIVPDE
ncbi:hypothetical protein FEZ51_08605 [Pediococcus stilesii]|uniref:Uncharacterized protein n=1 Tax=Pediococcus stilesii TaxID=331679 RepID=A0A5R9BSQ4_9LACO|nr:hypothetical protein [Pediococcus stilesii]TLQ03655.1 hypothetical protein FEZ51_08605 [Pediococcus stilesii]